MSQDTGRRAQQRFAIDMPVVVTYQDRTFEVRTRNVSLGGMYLEFSDDIPFGALVQLEFRLPELSDPVTVDAHVRWVEADDGIGVQFGALRAREVWALQKLFAAHP